MAACHVKSIQFKGKKRKRGFYEFVNGRSVWRDALDPVRNESIIPLSQSSEGHTQGTTTNHGHGGAVFDDIVDPTFTTQCSGTSVETSKSTDYVGAKKKVSVQWATLREQLVQQLVKNAFPSQFKCCLCAEENDQKYIYRCEDCGPHAYYCHTCCERIHSIVFLHIPQMWNEELQCFQDCKTQSVWKRPDSHHCETTSLTPLTIIDDQGRQHYHKLQICKCHPTPVILLQYGLWAASPCRPRTAFTLGFMLNLRSMVLEGQISLLAFCSAMQQCRRGLARENKDDTIQDIYRVISWESVLNFMAVYHSLTYMQFLEIGLPDGSNCDVCPEITDGEGRRMSMDGNMNLVHRRKAGHSVRDPIHKDRFFLPQDEVDQYLEENDHLTRTKEKTCSNFQAGSVLRTKNKTEKLDVTGTFASICCHDFPCLIFNLRHGERMAYPIFMMKSMENVKVLLYDLGCLMETVVKNRKVPTEVTFGVPIFHVQGHNMGCQLRYSPRSLLGAGLFDGEGTERLWSYLGKFCIMTKEMTPENRIDLLVEALLNYSQKLTLKMGKTLCLRLAKAHILRKSTKKSIEEDLQLHPGTTLEDIERWSEEEKEKAAECEKKRTLETWEAFYALELEKYYSLLDKIEEEADAGDHAELTRVAASLRRIEKTNHVKNRWSKTSRLYNRHLPAACLEERSIKLAELRDTVVEYSYMVSKKSDAKGQSQAKRVSQQAISASRKVNTALQAYNKVPPYGAGLPHHLQRSDVAALDADIWYHLAPTIEDESGVPAISKRKLIDCSRLNKRADEEIKMTVSDMKRLIRSLLRQDQKLSSKIDELKEKESLNAFESGCLCLLVRRLKTVYSWQNAVVAIVDKHNSSEEINVEEFVEDIESEMSKTTNLQMEEDESKKCEQEIMDALESNDYLESVQ